MLKEITLELTAEDMRSLQIAAAGCRLAPEEYAKLTLIAGTLGVAAVNTEEARCPRHRS